VAAIAQRSQDFARNTGVNARDDCRDVGHWLQELSKAFNRVVRKHCTCAKHAQQERHGAGAGRMSCVQVVVETNGVGIPSAQQQLSRPPFGLAGIKKE